MAEASNPSPVKHGEQKPADKCAPVPVKTGQTRKDNGQMPTADARLPSRK
jgi:hypothetical protein